MKRLMSSVVALEQTAEQPVSRSICLEQPPASLSPRALWGEVVAAVSVEAASRGVTISLEVDDGAGEQWDDPAQAMRVFKNLTLAAVRLTARETRLRIRVHGSPEQQRIELQSVCSSEAEGRPRLYRAARSVPSEESFAVNAARAFLGPRGGTVDALYMQNFGVTVTLHVPRKLPRQMHAAG
jgi:signal transduction histidine kinase